MNDSKMTNLATFADAEYANPSAARCDRRQAKPWTGGLLALGAALMLGKAMASEAIVFEDSIAPLLRQNCVACHHAKKAEGGLNLEDFASLSRGGDSGPVLDGKDPAQSLLLGRVTGRVDSIMPPADNSVDAKPLAAEQIALIERWIATGAHSKGLGKPEAPSHYRLPPQIQTTYALSVTADGQWLAFPRGNDLFFLPISDWSKADAMVGKQQVIEDAHADCCFAMASSPDGVRIATGSQEEVKLWRRRVARRVELGDESAMAALASKVRIPASSSAPSDGADKLQYQGASLRRVASSGDGTLLATLDEENRLRLWKSHDASALAGHPQDRTAAMTLDRLNRDVDRQKRRIERGNKKLSELKEVVSKEAAAVEASQKGVETAKGEWEPKQKELGSLEAARVDQEKAVAQFKAAVEAAKQQLASLGEKQKQEKAENAERENAIAGTQALIDIANQKLTELTPQLDEKKKGISQLQPQVAAAKSKLEAAEQGLMQAQESHRIAVAAVDRLQTTLAPEPAILDGLVAEADRIKKGNAQLTLKVVAMAFTGNGKHLVTLNEARQMEIWETEQLTRIAPPIPIEAKVVSLVGVGDRDVLLAGSDKELQRWSIETKWELECTWSNEHPEATSDRVNALAFNHDGTRLAIGSGNGSRTGHLAVLDLGELRHESFSPEQTKFAFNEPEMHSDAILGLAYSPDGRMLASCGADKMVKIIDADSGKQIRNLEGHTHHVLGAAWQEEGLFLTTTGGDGSIKVWDTETGEVSRTINVGKELTALGFLANSTRFVSAVIDHTVRMHDIHSNDQVRQFASAQNALYALALSPDGKHLVAAGQEGIPRVWQSEDGKLVAEIKLP